MQNGRFINTIAKLQNEPRWAEHYPRFKDNGASHSMRVGLYSLLAGLIQREKYGFKVNLEQVVCAGVYHDINETQIGPMKHRTKKEERVEELILQLEKEENNKIVKYLSSSLQPAFYNYIVRAEDISTIEGRIVDEIDTFDGMLFCHRECRDGSNSQFFQETFEKLAKMMRESELECIRYLMEAFDEKGTFYNFMYEVMMLDQVERWKGRFNTIEDNDQTHEFRCAALAIFFATLEKKKYGIEIDMAKLVGKVLCHDIPEIRTGDVLGPVKHSSPEMKKAFEEYEKQVATEIVEQLPDFLRPYFMDYMVNAKDDSYEGQLVDIVDKIDALIKTNMERRINYREYELSYRRQLSKIQKNFDNPCVVFFLAYILHDLDYPMFDEI